MIETLVNGYSSENAQQELSSEYQHDRVLKDVYILMDESILSIERVKRPVRA